jgi:peptidoglycan/LPS O-acetylase OafA/YrhL
MRDTFRLNNFDLLRLGAALEVAVQHANFHLEVAAGWWGFIARIEMENSSSPSGKSEPWAPRTSS